MSIGNETRVVTPHMQFGDLPATIAWVGGVDGELHLLDQTRLPTEVKIRRCRTVEDVHAAIYELCVRGAPAIGVAAAFGLVLAMQPHATLEPPAMREKLAAAAEYLAGSRPTAVNLFWALDQMRDAAEKSGAVTGAALHEALLAKAQALAEADAAICRRIGEAGAALVPDGGGVLTHCNAGALATVAYGTALSCLYVAYEQGKRFKVFADETRPLLQGARLTAFELAAAGLDVTVLCDNAAAALMHSGAVQMVVVGADRIAANGDTANKIGTYGLALLAKAHGIPFYVAAPESTFDFDLPDGSAIPIEQRPAEEVGRGFGRSTTPRGVACYNPAFDVTPASLITAIITERGVIEPVSRAAIADNFASDA